jgi:type IV pilus assembly protein PilC
MAIDLTSIKSQSAKATSSNKKEEKGIFDFLNKDIKFGSAGLNDQKKEHFYSELNILFGAGIDIKSALELIEAEQTKSGERELFKKIKDAVVNGSSMSAAIEHSGQFSPYEYFSLRIGEESGKLPVVLVELSSFFTKKIKQKRMVVSALTYPAIVFSVSVGAIFFMMNFIVPMFSDVFKRFKGGKLPYITQVIIDISNALSAYSLYFFGGLAVFIAFIYSQKTQSWFRNISSKIVMRMPIAGDIVQKIFLARFCHSMGLLIGAKTPMIDAIRLVKKMIGFYPIEYSLDIVEEKIFKGESLNASLAEFPIYNKRMISLVKVAEEVNQLDTIFNQLAEQYSNEVEHQTSLIGSLIEPFMIIFLGLMVAVILISMYLPLFQLSTSFG